MVTKKKPPKTDPKPLPPKQDLPVKQPGSVKQLAALADMDVNAYVQLVLKQHARPNPWIPAGS
jgi:hypothetical protein